MPLFTRKLKFWYFSLLDQWFPSLHVLFGVIWILDILHQFSKFLYSHFLACLLHYFPRHLVYFPIFLRLLYLWIPQSCSFFLKYLPWVWWCLTSIHYFTMLKNWNFCVSGVGAGEAVNHRLYYLQVLRYWASDFSSLRNLSAFGLRIWLLIFWELSRLRELEKFQHSVCKVSFSLVLGTVHSPSLYTAFPRAVMVLSLPERRWVFGWGSGGDLTAS